MKKINLIIFFLVGILFFSCKESQDLGKVAESYGYIHSSFAFTEKIQQKFLDKSTEALRKIIADKNVVIDTKELSILLDSAKLANQNRLPLINQADEIDQDIKYKEKVLRYVNFLDTLYNNEFKEFIQILAIEGENRGENISKLLTPKMLKLEELGKACNLAGEEIRSKYNIEVTN